MLERTDSITNEVLEPITFFLAYRTVFQNEYVICPSVRGESFRHLETNVDK